MVILQNRIDEQGATNVESLWERVTNHERLRSTALIERCCDRLPFAWIYFQRFSASSHSLRQGWPNYGPLTILFWPPKYLARFFQAPHFRLWTAVPQHWLLTVTSIALYPPVDRQSRIRPKTFGHTWFKVCWNFVCCVTTCFKNKSWAVL